MLFTRWLSKRLGLSSGPASRRNKSATRPRFRPMLEALEARWVPSTLTVTSAADSGTGSLRAEISAAHNGDTIVFASSLDGKTITLTSGELLLKKNLTIQGPGAGQLTISDSQSNPSRIFEVGKGLSQVTLSDLTISNGRTSNGGGIEVDAGSSLKVNNCILSGNNASSFGGGIANYGTLTVSGCTLSGDSTGYSGGGGAIANDTGASLTLTNSTLSNNTAPGEGDGGGIDNSGAVTITGSTLSGNSVGYGGSGGGITNDGQLSISGSTFSGNSAGNSDQGSGGAICSFPPNTGAYQLTASDCTFINNSAAWEGGALFVSGSSGNRITGCTFGGVYGNGNSAVRGGAIFDEGALTLSGCTLSYNAASDPAGQYTGEGGGLYLLSNATAMIENGTSITSNTAVYGGGIYIDTNATVKVENSSSITGNLAPSGYVADDVYNLGTLFLDSTSAIGILDGNPAQPI